MAKLKIYLAGPEVFLPDAVDVGAAKKALCEAYGFVGLFPLDQDFGASAPDVRMDHAIYRGNLTLIRDADIGVCNLTPFRGPSADVGTVFELGMLLGSGKPVFGYSNDDEDYLTRMRAAGGAFREGDAWYDKAGMLIEDFSNGDNLMIDASLALQGCPIVRCKTSSDMRFRDLRAFEECLRLARGKFPLVDRGAR